MSTAKNDPRRTNLDSGGMHDAAATGAPGNRAARMSAEYGPGWEAWHPLKEPPQPSFAERVKDGVLASLRLHNWAWLLLGALFVVTLGGVVYFRTH